MKIAISRLGDRHRIVLMGIQELAKAGASLDEQAASETNRTLVSATCRLFGAWPAAVQAATASDPASEIDIPAHPVARKRPPMSPPTPRPSPPRRPLPRRRQVRPNREKIVATIRSWQGSGASLDRTEVERQDPWLLSHAERLFTTWRRALVAARLAPPAAPDGSPAPAAAAVLRGIRARHEAGGSLRFGDVRKEDPELTAAARDEFRSWQDAVRLAALRPTTVPDRQVDALGQLVLRSVGQRLTSGGTLAPVETRREDPILAVKYAYSVHLEPDGKHYVNL